MPEKESAPDQPTPDSQQISEQGSDSGIRNNEVPVDGVDETSLAQADALGLTRTNQDSIAALAPAETSTVANEPSATEEQAPTSKMTTGKKIGIASIAVAAGTVLIVGAVFASKAGSDAPKNASPLKNPVEASQSPQPSATEVTPKNPNFAELIAAQEIKSGQTPEALASDLTDRLNNWKMAGTDTFQDDYKAEALKTGDGSDASRTKFAHDYAMKQFVNIFGPALYGIKAGDTVEPQLQNGIDIAITINSSNLELHWITSAESTPYVRGDNLDPVSPVRVESQNSDKISLAINYSEFDNSNLNTAAAAYASYGITPPSGIPETLSVTLQSRGGVEKITAYVANFR